MVRTRGLIPTLALLAFAGAATAMDTGIQIHGFASQGYLTTRDNNLYGRSTGGGTFELNELALNATATPIDRVRIGIQVLAYDLGKYGNDKPQIDWAFGEYQVPTGSDAFDVSLVAGRFKTGLALYNDYRDLDMTRTPVFLPSGTYSALFRDVYLAANGGQVNTVLRAGAIGSFDLSGFVGTQNIDPDGGYISDQLAEGMRLAATAAAPAGVPVSARVTSIDVKRVDGGYLNWNTPVDGLRLKGSVLHASHLRAVGDTQVLVPLGGGVSGLVVSDVEIDLVNYSDAMAGAELQTGDWTFSSEFSNIYYKAVASSGGASRVFYSRQLGAYASVNYQLSRAPAPFDHLQLFAAANWVHDRENDDPVNSFHRGITAAVRYDITDHFLVKAEFQRNRGTLLIQAGDNPGGISEYWNVVAIKTTFDF